MTPAPIALFVHARPAHTKRAVESLAANPLARASDLFVFADAPKKPGQEQAVREVRDIVRRIEGFASVTVIERAQNLGLSGSITDGVSSLCRDRGRVIAIEDDLELAPGLLDFLNRGLERFANNARVFQISGYMYPGDYGDDRAFFLPMISCWGWATWKRAWDHYDPKMQGFSRLAANKSLRQRFDLEGAYDYYAMACQQRDGKVDSWGIRWHLSVFMHDGLVLYPPRSLVQNAGVDLSGTHGAGHKELQRPLSGGNGAGNEIVLPDRIEVDAENFAEVKRLLRSMRPGLVRRFINWLLV